VILEAHRPGWDHDSGVIASRRQGAGPDGRSDMLRVSGVGSRRIMRLQVE
jgi:hypothetical protein